MSINDRDLGIVGVGAFLTVLCLLIDWPFVLRIVTGLLILVVFMIVALMRVGPDRVTLEEFMARRLRSSLRPRRFSYRGQGTGPASAAPHGVVFTQPASLPIDSSPALVGTPVQVDRLSIPVSRPVAFAWEEVGVYRLVTVWLGVIGLYFIYWLTQGGTQELGRWMSTLFMVSK
jgi:hypothetical protein